MSKFQDLSNFIWGICDDVLRGLFKPHEYGDVILPFVVLRRLDCVLEPQKEKVLDLYNQYKNKVKDPTPIILDKIGTTFFNTSKYDLRRLKQDPQNVFLNFNNYINGYDENVREIIENFQLDKPIEKLHKNNRLFLLIDRFSEVELHPDKVDNRTMGQIYEELLRRFSEMSNETSGDHYTPRDVVRLLVSLLFSGEEENLKGKGIVRSLFDPCCGTGGLLSIGKEWVNENINRNIDFLLYGQELNPQTYSICKSDMMLLGDNPNNIKGPSSSLSDDKFQGKKFDYMITNPPFGVSWKSEQEFVENESHNPHGRFYVGTPRVSDGSLLFLQHMISKMEDKGGRIGIVLNGSPLYTGDGGSGESEIRKWIIENDWLECIVSLPDQLFFNTGISTYLWIVTNRKKKNRKGKVQVINGSGFYQLMKKSLGSKRKYITEDQLKELSKTYSSFIENDYSKIFPNEFFGYTKVTIEQPLKGENGKILKDKEGKPKPDSSLRDYERVPLLEDIDMYYQREVKPNLPNSWMDRDKDKVGYEINFTKYFFQYKPLKSIDELTKDLILIEQKSEGIFNKIIERTSNIKKVISKGLNPNIEFKNSGIEWVGEIPKHWEIKKLKYLSHVRMSSVDKHIHENEKQVLVCNYTDVYYNQIIDKTIELRQGSCSEDEYEKFKVKKGDVIITKDSETPNDIGVPCYISENLENVVCGYHLSIITPNESVLLGGFLFRQLQTKRVQSYFEINSNGITRYGLGKSSIVETLIILPPIEEQREIIKFIDSHTNEISELVSIEQRRIDLLREHSKSLISEVIIPKQ